jgi:hypothetical protein
MADMNYEAMHGCACGKNGQMVARRNVELRTRRWEVDVEHETGNVHTNEITLGERPTLKEKG